VKVRVAELATSCEKPDQFPKSDLPEVAFLGRSNVGKSSLLNALVQRKQLARTSSTPGKTRMIHFFHVEVDGLELMLVDLPGYGWARVSRTERESWQHLVESYLANRPQLCAAILLQDVRRDFSEDETLLLEWLGEREVESLVVLTKVDKLKQMRRKARVGKLKAQIGESASRVLTTSSKARQGLQEVWATIRERIGANT
jgi:GTP-binding protein